MHNKTSNMDCLLKPLLLQQTGLQDILNCHDAKKHSEQHHLYLHMLTLLLLKYDINVASSLLIEKFIIEYPFKNLLKYVIHEFELLFNEGQLLFSDIITFKVEKNRNRNDTLGQADILVKYQDFTEIVEVGKFRLWYKPNYVKFAEKIGFKNPTLTVVMTTKDLKQYALDYSSIISAVKKILQSGVNRLIILKEPESKKKLEMYLELMKLADLESVLENGGSIPKEYLPMCEYKLNNGKVMCLIYPFFDK